MKIILLLVFFSVDLSLDDFNIIDSKPTLNKEDFLYCKETEIYNQDVEVYNEDTEWYYDYNKQKYWRWHNGNLEVNESNPTRMLYQKPSRSFINYSGSCSSGG